jgi:hypothetical protein
LEPETALGERTAEGADAAGDLRLLSEAAGAADPAPVKKSRWVPALADFLFLSLIVWLFLAGPNGWAALLSDGDTGWHIRVGDWIREHGAFPRQDFLSFSKEGAPWFAWEWGAELAMSYLHGLAGLKGVVLGLGLLIPAYLMVVFRHAIWRGATPLILLPVMLMASGSSAIHYLARPHLVTLLFLAVAMWIIEADRRRESGRVWLLVPLSLVWANLHGGFLSLVACLGMVSAGYVLGKRWARARRYGVLAAACLAVSIVNPYGYHLHEHILAYLRSDWIRNAVDEFQSPVFRSEAMLLYEILLIASLVCVYRTVRRGNWADALLVIGWAHLSLSSVRHVPIFLLVAAPVLAEELSGWWRELIPGLPRRAVLRTLDKLSRDLTPGFARNSLWIILPVVVLAVVDQPIAWPRQFPEAKFPVGLIERHQEDIEGKRVLTTDEWGDYLAYRFYPRQRVFFDGRSDFYGEALGKDYLSLMQGGPDAAAQIGKFRFDVVLVPREWPIQQTLRQDRGWELVAEEKAAVLFRRTVEREAKRF